jgi:uncharacterized protein
LYLTTQKTIKGPAFVAIEFDPVKDAENRRKHGLPLAIGEMVLAGAFIEEEDRRRDYGETRFEAIGPVALFDGRRHVAVYTWRDGKRRLISVRRANDREVRKYRNSHA